MFEYSGAFALPGISADFETYENEFWWGRWENQIYTGLVLSGAGRDAGGSPTTLLRSGLLLGKVTSSGSLKEWNPTGTDGSERIFGILKLSQNMQIAGVNADRYLGMIMIGGQVKASRILVPGNASLGISADTYEYLIRGQMFGRFMFDDGLMGNPWGGWTNIVAKTADYTITEADNNVLFTNRGASAGVNFTLPATAKKGLRYGVYVVAGQDTTLTAGTADTAVTFNDATSDSVALSTTSEKIGGHFEVLGDGTGWLVIPHLWEAQTMTIAT